MTQRILAVDDEGDMLRLMERIVRGKTSYEFDSCNNPMDVPELLAEKEYDLVITDLKMPGMDGLDILRHIREEERQEIVIVITAYGSLDSALEAIQLGAFNFITKPFKKDYLLDTIHRAMEHQKASRTAQRFRDLLQTRPFDDALASFKHEYISHALRSTQTDPGQLARDTGLSEELIRRVKEDE
ncbi:response regulator [bacterium]|nr:response regulator [bacterium]